MIYKNNLKNSSKYLYISILALVFFSACKTSKIQNSAGSPTVTVTEVPKTTTTGEVTAAASAVDISYNLNIKPLIDEQCGTRCHSPQWMAGGLDLSNYAGVKDAAVNGKLIKALQHAEGVKPMPKDGAQWDGSNIQLVIDWVKNGAAE